MSHSYRRPREPVRPVPRTTGDEDIDPLIPIAENRRDPYTSPEGYLQPDPVPIVRLNWPLVSQIFFAPAAFYSAVRQHEAGDQPIRNLELRANVARIYNALINVYYAQDHLEDAIWFYSARRASAVANLRQALQEAQDEPSILAVARSLNPRNPRNGSSLVMAPEFSMFSAPDFARILSEYTPCPLCANVSVDDYHTAIRCPLYTCPHCTRPAPGHSAANCREDRDAPAPQHDIITIGSLLREGFWTDRLATLWRAVMTRTIYDSEAQIAHTRPAEAVPQLFRHVLEHIYASDRWYVIDSGRVVGIFADKGEMTRNTFLWLEGHARSCRTRERARELAQHISRPEFVDESIIGERTFGRPGTPLPRYPIMDDSSDSDEDRADGDLPIPIPPRPPSSSPPAYEPPMNSTLVSSQAAEPAPTPPSPPSTSSSTRSHARDAYFDLVHTETGQTEAIFIRHGSGGTSLVIGSGTSEEPHEILEV